MGYQSKTWSLSDEVVEAVEKAREDDGLSPNQYLLKLIRREVAGQGAETDNGADVTEQFKAGYWEGK